MFDTHMTLTAAIPGKPLLRPMLLRLLTTVHPPSHTVTASAPQPSRPLLHSTIPAPPTRLRRSCALPTLRSGPAIPDKPPHPAISYWLTPAHASSLTAVTPHPEATSSVPLFTHRDCTAAPACYQPPCANAHMPWHGLASGMAPGEAGSNSSAHAPT
jgi:hypothetical protein